MNKRKSTLQPAGKRPLLGAEYVALLEELRKDILLSRTRAILAANREQIGLYWRIGKKIVQRQDTLGWGRSVVEQLSRDLRKEFPGTLGFSTQNLWYMRQFFLEYQKHANLQRLIGEIPWGSKYRNILENILSGRTGVLPAVDYWESITRRRASGKAR